MGISIVIPLYNKEQHIRNTLDRVFLQSYSDYEVIVVDDGSTDRSAEIVKCIDDPRIRLFSQNNQGAAAARNQGVSLARNEYVAFLDADDEWDENYLEEISRMISTFPEAVAYGTNYRIIENGKTTVLSFPGVKPSTAVLENYFLSEIYTPLWTSTVVVKKKVFEDIGGFPVQCKVCEDIDLWCSLALKGTIVYYNAPLANYRRDSSNMLSHSTDTTMYFPFLDEYEALGAKQDSRYETIRSYVNYKQVLCAAYCVRNFRFEDAKQILHKISQVISIHYYSLQFLGYN